MEYSLDALALKQRIHSNNIANADTPGYKSQSLTFKEVIDKVGSDDKSGIKRYKAEITTDQRSSMPDESNVDLEKENIELYKTYVQTVALYQKISGEFKNTRYVINQTLK